MPREQVRAQTAAAPASDVTPRPTPKKPAAAGPRMPWWLVVLGLMYVYRWYAAPVDGCGHGDPLVRELPRFDNVPLNDLLDSVVGETTGGGLRRLGLIDMQRSHLHADVFRNTRGFVMAFNREGAEDAFAGPRAPLKPFFDKVADAESNSFVLSVVVCRPAPKEGFVVDAHVDDTAAIRTGRAFLAKHVSVLYLQVPEGMSGGALHLHTENPETAREPPQATVHPEEGKFVQFRGNAYHRVQGFSARRNMPRISLVLESYVIPSWSYWRTVRFEMVTGSTSRTRKQMWTLIDFLAIFLILSAVVRTCTKLPALLKSCVAKAH